MAKLLWEWKPRFAVALVVRGLLIVTSQTNCDVTSCPVVMRRYANADVDDSGTRRRKRKFPLLFVNCDRGRIEIDHLYGLRCRGWYCNPEQHSLCRPARPTAWLVLQSGTALVVPAGAAASGRATAGTTSAVPDCSTNHDSADRIVVNSYNQP